MHPSVVPTLQGKVNWCDHRHLVPDMPDVPNMPNVPRGAQTCPDVPRRDQTCPDVPRRAQTCSDVPRPDQLYHRGANGAVTTPLQGCEWEVLKESVVFCWT